MIFNKTSEIKEIIGLYLATSYVENDNVVLIDKHNKDNIIVFDNELNYKWKQKNQDGIGIHIWDKENQIEIRFKSLKECDDSLDRLILGNRWMFNIM